MNLLPGLGSEIVQFLKSRSDSILSGVKRLVGSEFYVAGGRGHVHTNRDRKLNFCINNGLDIYFHKPNQFFEGGGALLTPPGGG